MLEEYYNRRAPEYETIYAPTEPEQQKELDSMAEAVKEHLAGRSVLEVACGTGYWTRVAAETSRSITATDISQEMLAEARNKGLPADAVTFLRASAFDLGAVPGSFDGALANFWFSHVPRARIAEFLNGLHARLQPGSHVLMADNVHVEGLGGELVTVPGKADTYKRRTLQDGSQYLVLKNYYEPSELEALLSGTAEDLQVVLGKYYWWVSYTTRGNQG